MKVDVPVSLHMYRNPSDLLKDQLGHRGMDERTLVKRLIELSINPNQKYITADELVSKVKAFNDTNSLFDRFTFNYKPKSKAGRSLLDE
jgi:hypothetical protein